MESIEKENLNRSISKKNREKISYQVDDEKLLNQSKKKIQDLSFSFLTETFLKHERHLRNER